MKKMIDKSIIMGTLLTAISLPTWAAASPPYFCLKTISCYISNGVAPDAECSNLPANWFISATARIGSNFNSGTYTLNFSAAQSDKGQGSSNCDYVIHSPSTSTYVVVSLSTYNWFFSDKTIPNQWRQDAYPPGTSGHYCFSSDLGYPNISDPQQCPFVGSTN